jgi:hypothetical protein
LNDSSSPIENSSRMIPNSANGVQPAGIGDGDVPATDGRNERAQAIGADQQADEDEADDRRDAEAARRRG